MMAAPSAVMLLAAGVEHGTPWLARLWANIWDPWFVFGMIAQGVFFFRFLVQWIVSERRKRSTIPIAFWYLSLVGGLLTFVYACKRVDPVFMLGQALGCIIYIRNLMLIYARQGRVRKRVGQRVTEFEELESEITQENAPEEEGSGV